MKEWLYDKLEKLSKSDEYAFHMPGHKRMETEGMFREIMKLDITEIDGFDNLYHAEEILKEEQDFACRLYGSQQTFFLVNGSTVGILSAIFSTTSIGEKILIARNSHKSIYNAVALNGLTPHYLYPQHKEEKSDVWGDIKPEHVAEKMEQSGSKIVFLTSPTYEGIVSNIAEIAKVVHDRDGVLIVDEAHGAHLGFHSYFPESAIKQGADLVIQSVHKTLPGMTQTALLHICSNRVSVEKIAYYLSVFQTSSPSYVLMASMSRCFHMIEEKGNELFDSYADKLELFYEKSKELTYLKILEKEHVQTLFDAKKDPSKIVIYAENLVDKAGKDFDGTCLAKELQERFHLQMEMVSEHYVIAMTSIYDTQEGFHRLVCALLEIDKKLCRKKAKKEHAVEESQASEIIMSIHEAMESKKNNVLWEECQGKISAEYIYVYPPGSPILVPGERITDKVWKKIELCKKKGLNLQGMKDYELNKIFIVEE